MQVLQRSFYPYQLNMFHGNISKISIWKSLKTFPFYFIMHLRLFRKVLYFSSKNCKCTLPIGTNENVVLQLLIFWQGCTPNTERNCWIGELYIDTNSNEHTIQDNKLISFMFYTDRRSLVIPQQNQGHTGRGKRGNSSLEIQTRKLWKLARNSKAAIENKSPKNVFASGPAKDLHDHKHKVGLY